MEILRQGSNLLSQFLNVLEVLCHYCSFRYLKLYISDRVHLTTEMFVSEGHN